MRSKVVYVGGLGSGKEQVKALFVWPTNQCQWTLVPACQPQAVKSTRAWKKKTQNMTISALAGHACVYNNTSAEKKFLSDHGWNWISVVTSPRHRTAWKILIILICQKYMLSSLTSKPAFQAWRFLYACKDQPCPAHAELKTPVSPCQGCGAQAEVAQLLVMKTEGKSILVIRLGHTIHWQGRPM